MSPQAINSIALYRGNTPKMIKRALKIQNKSVVEELKQHFNLWDLDALAERLSFGE